MMPRPAYNITSISTIARYIRAAAPRCSMRRAFVGVLLLTLALLLPQLFPDANFSTATAAAQQRRTVPVRHGRRSVSAYSELAGLVGASGASSASAAETPVDIADADLEALTSVLESMAVDFSVEGALAQVWKAYRDTPEDFDGYSPVSPEGEAAFYRHLRLPSLEGRAGRFHLPATGRLTSIFGYRPRFRRMHRGVDIAVRLGDTIRAAYDGIVAYRGREPRGYGDYIVISHAGGIETLYGHLSKFLVASGQDVKAGQAIALGGSSGRSTGPHLHFETRFRGMAVDPFEAEPRLSAALGYAASNLPTAQPQLRPQLAALQPRAVAKAMPQADKNLPRTYTARKGDSPASIARRFHLPLETLCRLNSFHQNQVLYSGQIIKLR